MGEGERRGAGAFGGGLTAEVYNANSSRLVVKHVKFLLQDQQRKCENDLATFGYSGIGEMFVRERVDEAAVTLCSPPQNVMDQFNPGLRNMVNLGKNYEKSVTGKRGPRGSASHLSPCDL